MMVDLKEEYKTLNELDDDIPVKSEEGVCSKLIPVKASTIAKINSNLQKACEKHDDGACKSLVYARDHIARW